MALIITALTLVLVLYQAESEYVLPKPRYDEVRVPRFADATLPCQFSFIYGTDNLRFSWHREDIIEEIEVEDIYAYIQQKYDFKEPELVYSYHGNRAALEEQSYSYQGRVKVDMSEIGDGDLSLTLHNVDYQDEALYSCKAYSPHGKGDIKLQLMIQEEEEPPVHFDTVNNETVVRCVSSGWYKVPIVMWFNRREEDITANSTVEVLEEKEDGSHLVASTLSGVKSHEIYRCLIRDAKKARRARTIHRKLKKGVLREYGEF
ncbi:butyrophilin-like protein 10 [Rhinophrynus dorsalis]